MSIDQDLTRSLVDARELTRACFHATPESLNRAYAPGKWTARQVLFHLVDTEAMFLDRLRRLLSDAKPLLWAIDPDRWQARLDYANRSMPTAEALFLASRDAFIDLAHSIQANEWDRAGVHSEMGKLSVRDAIAKCLSHNLHHLGQVEAAIAARMWTKA